MSRGEAMMRYICRPGGPFARAVARGRRAWKRPVREWTLCFRAPRKRAVAPSGHVRRVRTVVEWPTALSVVGVLLLLLVAPLHGQDPKLTPGVAATEDTAIICHRSTATVRHTTAATKAAVYREYHIAHHRPGEYEVDHLVPLELGGADTLANLWPQPALPHPGFHDKDKLENDLHRAVCSGKLDIIDAQRIAILWRRYIGKELN